MSYNPLDHYSPHTVGSSLTFTTEAGETYSGVVLQIIEDCSIYEDFPNVRGFILAVGNVGETYDVIGYDYQITEVQGYGKLPPKINNY